MIQRGARNAVESIRGTLDRPEPSYLRTITWEMLTPGTMLNYLPTSMKIDVRVQKGRALRQRGRDGG